ncbi:hypothetical protein Nepgr_021285 [Nepenthes gracilis]|uniref:Uncharacterized protein ycf33 n=1 Tax=Nepenthes gracilis TaxID=150966 RepID=A0AAD3SZ93_NEPGR|nr:hypothetical protein Nepgr_021285 [Nepenthes gracilis]
MKALQQKKTMKASILESQFNFPKKFNETPAKIPFLNHKSPTPHLKRPPNSLPPPFLSSKNRALSAQILKNPRKNIHRVIREKPLKEDDTNDSANGYSRIVIIGAVSLGSVLLFMGLGEQKAFAWGPEGPLMEEFWDNMRRYALYVLTVSTGVAYAVFQPVYELLKNPMSAILVLTIIAGSIFIVSQVLSAMVGVSDFSYDYGY